ncbi:hypothetical protein GeomeDRAFT_2645 [Geobacter metallireducens RCH3]|uniref:Uncharacterized protein n=1 Tax=Geobacter metallireducens (strain ATCC 53774 / DSM 7210 / GS-15) TaxID=269799 RepID=Q39YW6_GEOMG|nr:hypothetical protein [Geobacter metallireducens]ABB30558.1 hypothetical protein Gmet_0313 [Geobacter metallireducens GS-15]EHP85233.1 hypothetical protein GeomeDRAFT_2645 [Geobacter metallireducens RCH3]
MKKHSTFAIFNPGFCTIRSAPPSSAECLKTKPEAVTENNRGKRQRGALDGQQTIGALLSHGGHENAHKGETAKDGKSWLLLKKKDRYATGEDILGENRSVFSGRTQEKAFKTAPGKGSGQKRRERIRLREALENPALKEAPAPPMPRDIRPMLATPAEAPSTTPIGSSR